MHRRNVGSLRCLHKLMHKLCMGSCSKKFTILLVHLSVGQAAESEDYEEG